MWRGASCFHQTLTEAFLGEREPLLPGTALSSDVEKALRLRDMSADVSCDSGRCQACGH